MSVAVGTSSALTPLQNNFGGLKKRVAAYVQGQDQAGPIADSGSAINAAVDELNTRKWHWLNKTQDFDVTATERTITMPSSYKKPYALFRLDSSDNEQGRLEYLIPKKFHDSEFDSGDGQPEHYTVRNIADDLLLTFSQAPDSTWATSYPKVRHHYYSRMIHFADDGDTLGDLEVPPEVSNFLIWYARAEIASIRGDSGQVRYAEVRWEKIWNKLVADDNDEQSDWSSSR